MKPDAGINFPSVDYVRTCITKMAKKYEDINLIVLNLERWTVFDYSSATALTSLCKMFHNEEKALIFLNLSNEWEYALRATGLNEVITCSNHNLVDCIRKLNVFENRVTCDDNDNAAENVSEVLMKVKFNNENDDAKGDSTNEKMVQNTIAGSQVVKPLLRKDTRF